MKEELFWVRLECNPTVRGLILESNSYFGDNWYSVYKNKHGEYQVDWTFPKIILSKDLRSFGYRGICGGKVVEFSKNKPQCIKCSGHLN
jgi:hypothetical protein